MKLETKVVHKGFIIEDESGYRAEVDAVLDDEWGWAASVTFTSHGLVTAEDAVMSLKDAAAHFIRQLEELEE